MTITCDGASDNRKMFAMFNSDADLSYKIVNVYTKDRDEIFFISDPPHLLKTIRNCFARGKLWVCILSMKIIAMSYVTRFAKTRHSDAFLEIQIFA